MRLNNSPERVPSEVQGWEANWPWMRAEEEAVPLPAKSQSLVKTLKELAPWIGVPGRSAAVQGAGRTRLLA